MIEYYKSSCLSNRESGSKNTNSVIVPTDAIVDDCWVDVFAPTAEEIEILKDRLGIPEDFIQDSLDEEERPRMDYDEDSGIVLIIVDIPFAKTEKTIMKYETTPIGIILTKKNIVTISNYDIGILDQFKNNKVKGINLCFRTQFIFMMLLSFANEYLRLLRNIDKNLDLTASNLSKGIKNSDLYEIMEISKTLVYFTTSLKSDEALLEKLIRSRAVKKFDEDNELLDDVIIEFKQAHEMSEIYSTIVNNTQDAYSSIINNNMNVVMKILAAATFILEIPNIFTSFFGQNCPMPWDESFREHPWPFICLTGICVIAIVVTACFMKKKDLLS
ncbi:MAG: magnesium transporter CorA family protein [Clostridia bacterium]|nr:magnesium transporter CorA family protein [Clostridia bacterium]